jgi:hypothetical protein
VTGLSGAPFGADNGHDLERRVPGPELLDAFGAQQRQAVCAVKAAGGLTNDLDPVQSLASFALDAADADLTFVVDAGVVE